MRFQSKEKRLLFEFAKMPFSKVKYVKGVPQKLIFNSEGTALVFEHDKGRDKMSKGLRGISIITLSNIYLFATEYVSPFFGTLNLYTFGSVSALGILSFWFAHIFSRRTIDQIWLHSSGDSVDIKFFNAFWIPKVKTYSIYDFGEKFAAFYTFTKIDSTTSGFLYISLESNIFKGNPDYEGIVNDIINGIPIEVGNMSKRKIKHFSH